MSLVFCGRVNRPAFTIYITNLVALTLLSATSGLWLVPFCFFALGSAGVAALLNAQRIRYTFKGQRLRVDQRCGHFEIALACVAEAAVIVEFAWLPERVRRVLADDKLRLTVVDEGETFDMILWPERAAEFWRLLAHQADLTPKDGRLVREPTRPARAFRG